MSSLGTETNSEKLFIYLPQYTLSLIWVLTCLINHSLPLITCKRFCISLSLHNVA